MRTNRFDLMNILKLFATIAVTIAAVGCQQSKGNTAPTPGTTSLAGAGSTFSSVLFKNWFDEYHKQHPDIVINYSSVGSGEGVRRFIGNGVGREDIVDFGASDAAMQDKEIAEVPDGALMLPITAGGVVLAYNVPDVKGELRLSREAYAGIFLGKITRWDDKRIAASNPGVKLPAWEIAPVIRSDSSGTTFAFTNHLDAISPEWHAKHGVSKLLSSPENAMRAAGNEGVASRIQQAVGSIGYIEYQFSRQLDLKIATLENKQGTYIKPAEEAFVAGLSSAVFPDNLRVFVPDPSGPNSYPIVTFSWALLRKHNADAMKTRAMQDLFRWCLTDGQKLSSKYGYVPLPPAVSERSLAALSTVSNAQ